MNTISNHTAPPVFEQLYISLRKKEGRVYTDEEVLQLPNISSDHPHASEWMMRKGSANRLVSYIEQRSGHLKILEVGCGNGWLCRQLSRVNNSAITGLDINLLELEQAVKLFRLIPNLHFIHGNLDHGKIKDGEYDMVIFAASIQYFSPLEEIIRLSLQKLNRNGELHILDSPFYRDKKEIDEAKKRTEDYFAKMDFSEMAAHYHHHGLESLEGFSYKFLYRPSFINNRIFNNKNPFPWLCIKKPSL